MIPLDQLTKGELATIETIETDELPLKLIEMGCLPGNKISLIQKAPFNDPLYLKIDESHLAIRKETAQHIFVRLIK
ncbi:MAG: ferrous iron transport protein A [Flavobacteriaceae bacterium TMED48]|jgi:ferrous iron transport protein A|nr:MAG: ferrous iron transport protein A [Flavobacteriaceae bacterium TMED48]|tara:strand:- start:821 stop:1048 length:228 start_codon:yes stop_codon:yes gene_type:complete